MLFSRNSSNAEIQLSEKDLKKYSELMEHINRWQMGKDNFSTEIYLIRVETYTDFPNMNMLETFIFLGARDDEVNDIRSAYRTHPSYSESDRKSLAYFFENFEKSNIHKGNFWQTTLPLFKNHSDKKRNTEKMAKNLAQQLKEYNQQHFPNMKIDVEETVLCL